MQLATVTVDGDPAVRNVVFRGWYDNPDELLKRDALLIATDSRNQKISELHHHPYSEICWYFEVRL